jgi:chromosome segregation ATPase
MKRFRFAQQALLRIRRQLRRQAEMNLARAHGHLQACRAEQAGLEASLLQLGNRLGAAAAGRADVWPLLNASRQLQVQLTDAREREVRLETDRRQAVDELRRRETELDVLKALRLREWRRYRQHVSREQQRVLDEIALGQWTRLQSGSAQGDANV